MSGEEHVSLKERRCKGPGVGACLSVDMARSHVDEAECTRESMVVN